MRGRTEGTGAAIQEVAVGGRARGANALVGRAV